MRGKYKNKRIKVKCGICGQVIKANEAVVKLERLDINDYLADANHLACVYPF